MLILYMVFSRFIRVSTICDYPNVDSNSTYEAVVNDSWWGTEHLRRSLEYTLYVKQLSDVIIVNEQAGCKSCDRLN